MERTRREFLKTAIAGAVISSAAMVGTAKLKKK
jgi:hypothetical protein